MKAVLFLVCLLTACSEFDHIDPYFVTPELRPYMDAFYKEAAARGVYPRRDKLEVLIQDLDDYKAFGLCWNRNMTVLIDRDFFNTHSNGYSLDLEALMFHELGHALLERRHSEKVWSLMNAHYCISCYRIDKQRRQQYLDELFNP